jgi:hypothetical protein
MRRRVFTCFRVALQGLHHPISNIYLKTSRDTNSNKLASPFASRKRLKNRGSIGRTLFSTPIFSNLDKDIHHGNPPPPRPDHRRKPRNRPLNSPTLRQKRLPLHPNFALRRRLARRRSIPPTPPIILSPLRHRNNISTSIHSRLRTGQHNSQQNLLEPQPQNTIWRTPAKPPRRTLK